MDFLKHVGAYFLMLKAMFSKQASMRMFWKSFLQQCLDIGAGSLPIVIIISVFLGAVTTVQTAYQLVSPLVPKFTIAQIVRDSMILELSPTVLCVVLAGVVGSKIASELGNMRVGEQIDAVEVMGINAAGYLVLPKILAALLMIPLLVGLSAVLGIWGGMFAGDFSGILDEPTFVRGLRTALDTYNIQFAFYKAYTFAFIISSIGCYFGYHVQGGAVEIGKASTNAVITSCILILLADYGLAALLLPSQMSGS
jgi:phospholipid/cholesterol/gamma-HCH transport system permease protein